MSNPHQYDTKYFYKIGSGESARKFWFQTPPKIGPDAPYKFGIIGELFYTVSSDKYGFNVTHSY